MDSFAPVAKGLRDFSDAWRQEAPGEHPDMWHAQRDGVSSWLMPGKVPGVNRVALIHLPFLVILTRYGSYAVPGAERTEPAPLGDRSWE